MPEADPEQWVLERVADRTEPDPTSDQGVEGVLWTAKDRVLSDAGKFSTPVTKPKAEAGLKRLRHSQDVLYWHGHLTLATDEYLEAVIESEVNAGVTRGILVGKCNRWLAESQEVPADA